VLSCTRNEASRGASLSRERSPITIHYPAVEGPLELDIRAGAWRLKICLALPLEVMARPGMAEKVFPFLGSAPPFTPGPTRAALLGLVS
jgi:hypothetical protein